MADFSGPKGESLFSDIEGWCADPDRFPSSLIESTLGVVKHLKDQKQDRLLVLLGALLVEGAVDEILKAAMPGFGDLQEMREITFAVKIAIVRAMRLCPVRLLTAADVVRRTRNDFVHDLEVGSLGKLPERVATMRIAFKTLRPDSKADKTDAELFDGLVSILVGGLWLYAERIGLAFRYLRSDTFMEQFKEHYDTHLAPAWKTKSTEIQGLYELLRKER